MPASERETDDARQTDPRNGAIFAELRHINERCGGLESEFKRMEAALQQVLLEAATRRGREAGEVDLRQQVTAHTAMLVDIKQQLAAGKGAGEFIWRVLPILFAIAAFIFSLLNTMKR